MSADKLSSGSSSRESARHPNLPTARPPFLSSLGHELSSITTDGRLFPKKEATVLSLLHLFVCETHMRHISHTYPVPVPSADSQCCPKTTSSPVAVVTTLFPEGGVLEEVTENAPMQAFSAKIAFYIPCQRPPPRLTTLRSLTLIVGPLSLSTHPLRFS
ncbi:hypothetical protein KC338_g306 [Hortaea werneckii]|nr:hypothetical protein KC338_g306 [Hortaea werneckii]